MANISGYTGYFKEPIPGKLNQYGPAIYVTANTDKNNIIMIILTPEAFKDAYLISKNMHCINITYIVPALDALFISDIFNLYMLIRELKPFAKWIFPSKPPLPTSIEFENAQIQTDVHTFLDFSRAADETPYIRFIRPDENRNFYDILLFDGHKTILFSQYMTAERMGELFNNPGINEIHLAYTSTLYGGLTYPEIIKLNKRYARKVFVHSFRSFEEYDYARNSGALLGRMVYDVIIQTSPFFR